MFRVLHRFSRLKKTYSTQPKRIIEALKEESIGQNVKIQGWLRSIRQQKSATFLNINDGSCLSNFQAVVDNATKSQVELFDVGASVEVTGKIVQSLGSKQKTELFCDSIENVKILGTAESFPLQKKFHTPEYLRDIAHLRPRANQMAALLRIRNQTMMAVHNFFQENSFINVHTPILSGIDCEGAGEQFSVSAPKDPDFFGKQAYLTVSGQLEAEIFANSMGNVYTFGPTFRAESGKTSRHLSEFWMIEMEKAFCDLPQNIECIEKLIKYLVKNIVDECKEDLELFQKYVDPTTNDRLQNCLNNPFAIVTYEEVLGILKSSGIKFEFPVYWGCDLSSEHEIYICKEHFKRPTFVINYPQSLKPFYARINEDGKTVACVDLFVSNVGELVGGSQREERFDVLKQSMIQKKVDIVTNEWYLDLRKYGTTTHSGFGVGFERLLMFITGISNIRDVIPIPRHPGYIKF